MYELLWVARMGFYLWICWRAVVMLDCTNPLMGAMFGIVFMIGGPMFLDWAGATYAGKLEMLDLYVANMTARWAAPLGFGLVGVYLWNVIETATIRAALARFNTTPATK